MSGEVVHIEDEEAPHEASLHYPLAHQETTSRSAIMAATQLRTNAAWALAKWDPDHCREEIACLLADVDSLLDAMVESEIGGGSIEATTLGGDSALLRHAETLRLLIEARLQSPTLIADEHLEVFAASLKQRIERQEESSCPQK